MKIVLKIRLLDMFASTLAIEREIHRKDECSIKFSHLMTATSLDKLIQHKQFCNQ